MKKTFVKVLSALLVTVAFTVLAGCYNNAPVIDPLVGTWEITTSRPPVNFLTQGIDWFPRTIDIKADGAFSGMLFLESSSPFSSGWDSGNNLGDGTWSASSGKITITPITPTGKASKTFDYSVSGNTLTFNVGNDSVEFNKK